MLRFTSDCWTVFAVCLMVLLSGGCADTRAKMSHSWKKTWGYVDDHPNRPNIQSPNERVVELRELGKEAPQRSQEEQEEVSANLAKAIRTELDPFIRAEIVRALAQSKPDRPPRYFQPVSRILTRKSASPAARLWANGAERPRLRR